MADKQTAHKLADAREDASDEIVVRESTGYPWPLEKLPNKYGNAPKGSRIQFEAFLSLIRFARPQYHWIVFYLHNSTGINYISEYPAVLAQLERLFQDELGTRFSDEQRHLLLSSHIVVVAVHKEDGSIAGYHSSSYFPRGALPEVDTPLMFGNHLIIAANHQQFKLGVFMGAIAFMHGEQLRDLFKIIRCTLRTNNKHILHPLEQLGTVYRSDRLEKLGLSDEEKRARVAVSYMHRVMFGLNPEDLRFDAPLEIQHQFSPEVTIEGVGPNQIIYIYCMTSPIRAMVKLVARRARRTH